MTPESFGYFTPFFLTRIKPFPDIIYTGMISVYDQGINVYRTFALVLMVPEVDKILTVFFRFKPAIKLDREKVREIVFSRFLEERNYA